MFSTVVGSVWELSTSKTIFEGDGSKAKFLIFCSTPFSYSDRFSILIGSFLPSVREAVTLKMAPSGSIPCALWRDWPKAKNDEEASEITTAEIILEARYLCRLFFRTGGVTCCCI